MTAFNFGLNWRDYSLRVLDQKAIDEAEDSLHKLLSVDSLSGQTLLDLGCGSGLFSIAAARLGARVQAADINPLCLEVTQQNAVRFLQTPSELTTYRLSALDKEALASTPAFDIVYAWGVLHHTGAMWQAIENMFPLVKRDGKLVLSIYNKHITSPIWRMIKWFYVHMPHFIQNLMVIAFAGVIYIAKLLVTRQNPLKKERGMNYWYDVVDWIGGYPYEYATVEEITQFVTQRGFKVEKIVPAQVPTGCNEFVFVKNS